LPQDRQPHTKNRDLAAEEFIQLLRKDAADAGFREIFNQVAKTCGDSGNDVNVASTRRIAGRQVHRANIPAGSVEEYYMRTVFIEDFTRTGHVTSVAVADVNKPPPPLVADEQKQRRETHHLQSRRFLCNVFDRWVHINSAWLCAFFDLLFDCCAISK